MPSAKKRKEDEGEREGVRRVLLLLSCVCETRVLVDITHITIFTQNSPIGIAQ
jgi:hypothetical protein